jgi:hypothetical protein
MPRVRDDVPVRILDLDVIVSAPSAQAITPAGALFSFVPLPPSIVLVVLLLTLGYAVATEATKRWFYASLAPPSRVTGVPPLPASRSK